MNVAVLGADTTGRAVARRCALAGHTVSLHDEAATAAMDAIDDIEGRMGANEGALDRLDATTDLDAAVGDVAVVVETAAEDVGSLQKRLADVEELTGRATLVAPSATGVSVTAAAAGLRHPDRAVGLHFRTPDDRPLVEVVVADQTTQDTCERAREFVESLDCVPVVVRDTPGGVATRTALALEVEAMRLVEEDVAGVTAVDDALELGYEHPVGPLEQADRAGLDNRLQTLERLRADLGERFDPPDVLRERVASGHTGMASGEGFYIWENGEPTEPAVPDPDLPRRESGPDDPTVG